MAVYRNISLSFWTDSKVEDTFTPEDKYMYLYLLTNPHTNICGCYEVSVKQISRQTGYNDEMVERILDRLETMHNVLRYCRNTKEVLIINWGKYNWTKSEKLTKPIRAAIAGIKCVPFQDYVTKLYDELESADTVSIPYGYPIDTTGIDTTVSVSVTDTTTKGIAKGEQEFATFWEVYPNKKAKEAARKSFLKLKPDTALLAEMLKAIEIQKATPQWLKDDGQYIPMPSTWLNQKRWEDEIKTQSKQEVGDKEWNL